MGEATPAPSAPTKGFVLAAGFGQRLRPVTEHLPKPLLPVGRVPLIGYALRLLAHHGIRDVIVNVHHLGEQLRQELGEGERYGVRITYSVEEEILGTGGGVRRMIDQLRDGPFVLLNSDTLLHVDLGDVLRFHRERGALCTMVLRQDTQQAESGQVEIDAQDRVRRILGRGPGKEQEPAADAGPLRPCLFLGAHVIEPRFLEYLPPEIETCIVRYGYVKALQNHEPIYGYVNRGVFADAGVLPRYLALNAAVLRREVSFEHVDPLAGALPTREDPLIYRAEGVELGANVELLPPVLLGEGVRIGDRCRVGPNVVLGDRAQVGKAATLCDCVVTGGTRVEAGSVLRRALVHRKYVVQEP